MTDNSLATFTLPSWPAVHQHFVTHFFQPLSAFMLRNTCPYFFISLLHEASIISLPMANSRWDSDDRKVIDWEWVVLCTDVTLFVFQTVMWNSIDSRERLMRLPAFTEIAPAQTMQLKTTRGRQQLKILWGLFANHVFIHRLQRIPIGEISSGQCHLERGCTDRVSPRSRVFGCVCRL